MNQTSFTPIPMLADRERVVRTTGLRAVHDRARRLLVLAAERAVEAAREARGVPTALDGRSFAEVIAGSIADTARYWTELFDACALCDLPAEDLRGVIELTSLPLEYRTGTDRVTCAEARTAVLAEFDARLAAHVAAAERRAPS